MKTWLKFNKSELVLSRSTDHSREVTGSQHVFGVQREQNHRHAGEDEVAEGDVHSCLAAPVSRWYQTRDAQSGPAFNLRKKKQRNKQVKTSSVISTL